MRNKIVKRIAALLSVAVMCVSVVACGGGSEKAGADTLTEEEYEANRRRCDRGKGIYGGRCGSRGKV